MTTPALSCRQLIKTFDGTRALDDLDLTVDSGTIFGLLGPNGSGKTTTIRTALGIYKPDGGAVQLLGSANPLAVRRRTGYLPEERGLYARMKLREQLAFLASIRGLTTTESDRRAAAWLDRIGLGARAQSLTRELSKGNQQKVQFAAAVIHDPDLVVLDEPFSGLDLSAVLNARFLFYFGVFFSLGYVLYSVLFAVVAATCTSTEELGQSMMAAILPMVVALMVAISVISNPATTMTRVLSLIPFFTPLVMTARVNILMPPLWEVWLGIALLVAASVASGWVAAKIFRYALLMTGKRPTLPELIRVVKA